MGDHYLPKHYLKGFAVNDRFWVHDLELGKSRVGQPKTEANVNGLWPGELEQHLAEKIEGPAQKIIDRIRQCRPIESPEKEILAKYILTMWKRVPASRERTAKHIPDVAVGVRARYHRHVDYLASQGELTAEQVIQGKKIVDGHLDAVLAEQPDYLWHQTLEDGATPRMMEALRTMDWTFLVSDSDPFLTCDDPLFFFKEIGVGTEASELSIPLSSSITLLAHRQGGQRHQYKDARRSTVVRLNRRTAFNAQRFMYSEAPLDWALKFGARKTRPLRIEVSSA